MSVLRRAIVTLCCAASVAQRRGKKLIFKGWRDGSSFDVVLNPSSESIPIRFAVEGEAWRPATPNPLALADLGYACKR